MQKRALQASLVGRSCQLKQLNTNRHLDPVLCLLPSLLMTPGRYQLMPYLLQACNTAGSYLLEFHCQHRLCIKAGLESVCVAVTKGCVLQKARFEEQQLPGVAVGQ